MTSLFDKVCFSGSIKNKYIPVVKLEVFSWNSLWVRCMAIKKIEPAQFIGKATKGVKLHQYETQ